MPGELRCPAGMEIMGAVAEEAVEALHPLAIPAELLLPVPQRLRAVAPVEMAAPGTEALAVLRRAGLVVEGAALLTQMLAEMAPQARLRSRTRRDGGNEAQKSFVLETTNEDQLFMFSNTDSFADACL